MTDQLIQRVTEEVAARYARKEKQLFLVHSYSGNKAEFVHFDVLLIHKLYTAVVMEVDETTKTLFPPESLVWVYIDGNGTRVQEATCDDYIAKRQYEAAKELLRDYQTKSVTEGQFRTTCVKRKDIN